jgi:threonine dehydratase
VTATKTEQSLVTIEDIKTAASVLSTVAVRTPLLYDEVLSAKLGIDLWHKAEQAAARRLVQVSRRVQFRLESRCRR